jgi:thiol-disulfide isomerase/thioredoxin
MTMRWLLLCLATVGFVALFGCSPSTDNVSSDDATRLRVQATIYSADSCLPCRRYVAAVTAEMPPDGWIVRNSNAADVASAHVVIKKTTTPADKIEKFPTTIIRKDGREVDRIVGQITPKQLADRINAQLQGLQRQP